MLSSCRKAAGYAAVALAAAPAVWAQETFVVPRLETSAEYNTNSEMFTDASQRSASSAYKALLEATVGYKTPTSESTARPRVTLQEYPDRSGVDPVGLFLDARSRRKTERLDLDLIGRFARQDTFSAESGAARFDDFDPNNPGTADTGIVLVGVTRTSYNVGPKVRYNLTERALIGGELSYEKVKYDSDVENSRVGYKSPYAEVTGIYELGQRSEIEVGPYYTKFESDDGDTTDSVGALIGLHHEFSEVSRNDVIFRFESADSETAASPGVPSQKDSSSNWGLEFVGFRQNRVGYFRYSIGRFLSPSGLGNRRETDQIRLEYNRPMTVRFAWGGAGRFMQDRSLDKSDTTINSRDRDRAYGELYVTYSMTQAWYVRGGYRYAYLDDKNSTVGTAENHTAYLTFGYQGLSPPGRYRSLR